MSILHHTTTRTFASALTWRRFLDRFYALAVQKGSVRNETLSTGPFSAVERPFDSLEI